MSAARGRAAARVSAAVGVVVALYCLVPAPILGGDEPFRAPSSARWLGTDGQGQDVLSLLVHGAPRTLGVGLLSGLGMVVLGAAVALLAAWAPRAAFALNGLTTAMLALPGLPLMVLLAAWLPPGPATMVVVLVLTGWPWHARVLSAPARVATTHGWVEAARLAGESPWRLMIVEVLPSLGPILLAGWLGASAYALGAEVGLEYVGLAALDVNTWGTVLYWAANDAALLVGAWWVFLPVGVAIGATGLALLSVSRRLELWFDPRLDAVERARRAAFSPLPAAVEPDAPGVVLDIRSLRVGFADPDVAGG